MSVSLSLFADNFCVFYVYGMIFFNHLFGFVVVFVKLRFELLTLLQCISRNIIESIRIAIQTIVYNNFNNFK